MLQEQNRSKSKYPTHDSRIMQAAWVLQPARHKDAYKILPRDSSIHSSGYLSAILRLRKCFKTLGCSICFCDSCCGGRLVDRLESVMSNKAKMGWSKSFFLCCRIALSLFLCQLCLVGESGFFCFVK